MKLITFFILVFLFSCSSNVKRGADWGMSQSEINKLLKKEVKKIKRKEAELPDQFSFYIESKKAPSIKQTKLFTLITTEIDQNKIVECFFYPDRKDVAKHIEELTEKLISGTNTKKYLKSRAGSFGEVPYLSLYTQYLDESKNVKLLKILSARYKENQITCINKDMGLMNSFRRVVSNFLTSLNDKKHQRPKFEQIYFLSVGKNRFGYQYDRLTRKRGGGELFRFESHYINIKNDEEIEVIDELVLEAIDEKLNVEEVLSERYSNGNLVKRTIIRPENANLYSITRNLNGEEVQGSYPINNFRSRLKHESFVFEKLQSNKNYQDTTFWSFDDDRSPKVTTYSVQKKKGSKTYIKYKNKSGAGIWQYNEKGQVVLKIFKLNGEQAVLKRDFVFGNY